jgi:hypothetical protein
MSRPRAHRAALGMALALAACAQQGPPPPGTLLLSNLNFPPTRVEAVITANPDCNARDGGYVSTLEFSIPSNATRFIDAPPGVDVCWRRTRNPNEPVAGQWSGWDRAFLSTTPRIEAKL